MTAPTLSSPSKHDRWKNRRRMAWVSLLAGLGYPFASHGMDGAVAMAIAGPFYLFITAVVGTYIGFATVDDKWNPAAEEPKP